MKSNENDKSSIILNSLIDKSYNNDINNLKKKLNNFPPSFFTNKNINNSFIKF